MEATSRSQVSAAGEKVRETTQEMSKRAGERVREAGDRFSKQTQNLSSTVADYVDEHPFAALGIAAAAGFVLSMMLRR